MKNQVKQRVHPTLQCLTLGAALVLANACGPQVNSNKSALSDSTTNQEDIEVAILRADLSGSEALGIRGTWLWNHARSSVENATDPIQFSDLIIRDQFHPISKEAKLIEFRVGGGVTGCDFVLPGSSTAPWALVDGKVCNLQERKVFYRFSGESDFSETSYGSNARVDIPDDASEIEVYFLDRVRLRTDCRVRYTGSYPTVICEGEIIENLDGYVSNNGENFRVSIER